MKIRFWGVRGGLPSPGRNTIELGGNTPCTEIKLNDEHSILIDSGTGIIEYASKGVDPKKNKVFHILISHFHWDHIQGFPFFFPIHRNSVKIHLYSPFSVEFLRENIAFLFDGTYSPLRNISNLNADINFHHIDKEGIDIHNAKIIPLSINHTIESYAYKLITDDYTLVYALDHENNGCEINSKLIRFSKNADVLIHDAEYTQYEYDHLTNWGHSSIENAIDNAEKSNVKLLFLSSHKASHSDDFLRLYLNRFLKKVNFDSSKLIVRLAQENKIYHLRKNKSLK